MIRLFLLSLSVTSYWIEPCTNPETACVASDPQLPRWAFSAWENASNGRLHFAETKDRREAKIQVVWATPSSGLYGETVGNVVNIRIATDGVKDPLLRDTVVYLTCLPGRRRRALAGIEWKESDARWRRPHIRRHSKGSHEGGGMKGPTRKSASQMVGHGSKFRAQERGGDRGVAHPAECRRSRPLHRHRNTNFNSLDEDMESFRTS